MTTPNELKNLLFSIVESAFETPDVSATQQMGVQLSSAVKKDGVVIIQNQNVEVYTKIMPKVIQAIRMCDQLDQPEVKMLPVGMKVVEAPKPDKSIIKQFCEFLFVEGVTWQGMQKITKKAYFNYILHKFPTKVEAAKFLDLQAGYLSKLETDIYEEDPSDR